MTVNITELNDDKELLYHVKRTFIDFAHDPSGVTQTTDILNTFTNLDAAKAAARMALFRQGYSKDDFLKYEENDGTDKWKYGDRVMVVAQAPAGEEFDICLDTTPNIFFFTANAFSEVKDHLFYILKTTIYYDNDSSGSIQNTEVKAIYFTREDAQQFGKDVLIDQKVRKDSFAEYDEKDKQGDDWPYGDDVLVHAVTETGENFQISVKERI